MRISRYIFSMLLFILGILVLSGVSVASQVSAVEPMDTKFNKAVTQYIKNLENKGVSSENIAILIEGVSLKVDTIISTLTKEGKYSGEVKRALSSIKENLKQQLDILRSDNSLNTLLSGLLSNTGSLSNGSGNTTTNTVVTPSNSLSGMATCLGNGKISYVGFGDAAIQYIEPENARKQDALLGVFGYHYKETRPQVFAFILDKSNFTKKSYNARFSSVYAYGGSASAYGDPIDGNVEISLYECINGVKTLVKRNSSVEVTEISLATGYTDMDELKRDMGAGCRTYNGGRECGISEKFVEGSYVLPKPDTLYIIEFRSKGSMYDIAHYPVNLAFKSVKKSLSTLGANGGINPENGICGSSNGTMTTATFLPDLSGKSIIRNRCTSGYPIWTNTSAPFAWKCVGLDGGATVNCGLKSGTSSSASVTTNTTNSNIPTGPNGGTTGCSGILPSGSGVIRCDGSCDDFSPVNTVWNYSTDPVTSCTWGCESGYTKAAVGNSCIKM